MLIYGQLATSISSIYYYISTYVRVVARVVLIKQKSLYPAILLQGLKLVSNDSERLLRVVGSAGVQLALIICDHF